MDGFTKTHVVGKLTRFVLYDVSFSATVVSFWFCFALLLGRNLVCDRVPAPSPGSASKPQMVIPEVCLEKFWPSLRPSELSGVGKLLITQLYLPSTLPRVHNRSGHYSQYQCFLVVPISFAYLSGFSVTCLLTLSAPSPAADIWWFY